MKPACFYDTARTNLGQAPTVTSLHYSASKTQNMRSMWKIEIGKYFRLMTLAHCPLAATPNFVKSYGVPFSVADPGFPGKGRQHIMWPKICRKLHENEIGPGRS